MISNHWVPASQNLFLLFNLLTKRSFICIPPLLRALFLLHYWRNPLLIGQWWVIAKNSRGHRSLSQSIDGVGKWKSGDSPALLIRADEWWAERCHCCFHPSVVWVCRHGVCQCQSWSEPASSTSHCLASADNPCDLQDSRMAITLCVVEYLSGICHQIDH